MFEANMHTLSKQIFFIRPNLKCAIPDDLSKQNKPWHNSLHVIAHTPTYTHTSIHVRIRTDSSNKKKTWKKHNIYIYIYAPWHKFPLLLSSLSPIRAVLSLWKALPWSKCLPHGAQSEHMWCPSHCAVSDLPRKLKCLLQVVLLLLVVTVIAVALSSKMTASGGWLSQNVLFVLGHLV
jgi:hypothetical protein